MQSQAGHCDGQGFFAKQGFSQSARSFIHLGVCVPVRLLFIPYLVSRLGLMGNFPRVLEDSVFPWIDTFMPDFLRRKRFLVTASSPDRGKWWTGCFEVATAWLIANGVVANLAKTCTPDKGSDTYNCDNLCTDRLDHLALALQMKRLCRGLFLYGMIRSFLSSSPNTTGCASFSVGKIFFVWLLLDVAAGLGYWSPGKWLRVSALPLDYDPKL